MQIKESFKSGLTFGIASGIITTLGLMIGLVFGTGSKLAVIVGILTIAFADAFSDALGMHMSQESVNHWSDREVWEGTFATFAAKLIIALTFLVPIFFFELKSAALIGFIWGLSLIMLLSYQMAKVRKVQPIKVIGEHVTIAMAVTAITWLVGEIIRSFF